LRFVSVTMAMARRVSTFSAKLPEALRSPQTRQKSIQKKPPIGSVTKLTATAPRR
jgi:hypothetical protein